MRMPNRTGGKRSAAALCPLHLGVAASKKCPAHDYISAAGVNMLKHYSGASGVETDRT